MPIADEEALRSLLEEEQIRCLSIDTSIFDEKKLQFNSNPLRAVANLKDKPVDFVLSGTVAREVLSHLEIAADDALKAAYREIGKALFAFETEEPTRDQLIQQISGGKSAAEAARKRLDDYIGDTGCVVLEDSSLVDVATLFEGYFSMRAPFGAGKKKSEFPDALALHALENEAAARGTAVLVVSKDNDWKSFCSESHRLYLIPEVETALDLLTKAPLGVRQAIKTWAGPAGEGREQMFREVERLAERITIYVNGHATHGELEATAWAGKLTEIDWDDAQEIDVIAVEHTGGESTFKATISLPLTLKMEIPVELNFSIWDSVDRESVGLSGRTIEVDEELDVRATFTVDVYDPGTEDEVVDCAEGGIEIGYHEIDLGEVDVFDHDDDDQRE